jgi:hypothetical protein
MFGVVLFLFVCYTHVCHQIGKLRKEKGTLEKNASQDPNFIGFENKIIV